MPFFTKIAGVSHKNDDGTDRQLIIPHCRIGEALLLVREPNNPVDPFAVKVMRTNGEQLGYLGEHIARHGDPSGVAYQMDRGEKYHCRISSITGGGDRYYGVNIEVGEAGTEADSWDNAATTAPNLNTAPPTTPSLMLFILFLAVAIILAFLISRS